MHCTRFLWTLIESQFLIYFCIVLVGFGEKFCTQNKSISQGLPYDFRSIMHFRHNAFSRGRYKSTLIPHNRSVSKSILGSSATATDLDFLHLNLLYCGGKPTTAWMYNHKSFAYQMSYTRTPAWVNESHCSPMIGWMDSHDYIPGWFDPLGPSVLAWMDLYL